MMIKILYITGSILITVSIMASIFIGCAPQFGGNISKGKKDEYANSANYRDGKFIIPVPVMQFEGGFLKSIKSMISPEPNRKPKEPIEVVKVDSADLADYNHDAMKIIWFGHSTFLVQMEGMNILLDPMLGESASPIPWGNTKRFTDSLPISIDQFPPIDVVVYSHDHYDHLDYKSVLKLKDKVEQFYVPLGVGAHLTKWGVDAHRISEFDWWDSTTFNSIKFVCTPAAHFSGRGLFDRGATLWSSWSLIGSKERIFFSGDSGYGPHFKEIGNQYGPFDLSLIECGQYNESWKFIHMFPEESVQASIDLNSRVMMPIHWGSFVLSTHEWTDPVERAVEEARRLNVQITTPEIGESIITNKDKPRTYKWWLE